MSSEQKRMLGDVEIKVGQIWRSPGKEAPHRGQVVGFNTRGTALIEHLHNSGGYREGEITALSNESWVLEPEKKKVEYRVFKSTHTGDVSVFSGKNMENAEKWVQDWLALSPRLEYEYVEQVGE